MRQVALCLLLLVSCGKPDKPGDGEGKKSVALKPAAVAQEAAHLRGLENATAMVDNAALCEPQYGSGEVSACEAACLLNHSNSCANWAHFIQDKANDTAKARQLYSRACKGGSGIGCEGLARLQAANKEEAEQTFVQARHYHRVHCSQGYARSCSQLAELFQNALGGAGDEETAAMYRDQAKKAHHLLIPQADFGALRQEKHSK